MVKIIVVGLNVIKAKNRVVFVGQEIYLKQ